MWLVIIVPLGTNFIHNKWKNNGTGIVYFMFLLHMSHNNISFKNTFHRRTKTYGIGKYILSCCYLRPMITPLYKKFIHDMYYNYGTGIIYSIIVLNVSIIIIPLSPHFSQDIQQELEERQNVFYYCSICINNNCSFYKHHTS